MHIFATIVAQNAYFRNHSCAKCKFAQPKLRKFYQIFKKIHVEAPHVEPPHMEAPHVEAPHIWSTMVDQNAILRNHGCANLHFAQLWLRKYAFCATMVAKICILRNYSPPSHPLHRRSCNLLMVTKVSKMT